MIGKLRRFCKADSGILVLRAGLAPAILLLTVAGGPARAQTATDTTKAPATDTRPAKPITLGDDSINQNQPIKPDYVISVTVTGEAEPSNTYVVDQAGNVTIPYAGVKTPVTVKGLTPTQAADAVRKYLLTYIKKPQVSVSIVSVPHPVVYVSGAVQNAGPIIVMPDTTLMDVLAKSGWNDNADLSKVRIVRREIVNGEEKTLSQEYRFDRYIKAGNGAPPDESQNPPLQNKDRIVVPVKELPSSGVISVQGEVNHPAVNIPLRTSPPMTVREAINLVGGTDPLANKKAVVIRRASEVRPLVIDLDKAEDGDPINNIELRPDDAVYVEKIQNNAFINLDGGFVQPGRAVMSDKETLTQAVMNAGGPAPYAKTRTGRIFRHPNNDANSLRVITFNWDQIQQGKAKDIDLQPGDTVYIQPGGPSHGTGIGDILGILGNGAYVFNSFSGRWIPR